MSSVNEIENPGIRSGNEGWKSYLSLVHSKQELELGDNYDYSEALSRGADYEELDKLLGRELERDLKSKKQLAYDFGYSIAKKFEESNQNMLELSPDSIFLVWFEDFTPHGSEAPNPQYAVKGMTDFMEETGEYKEIL